MSRSPAWQLAWICVAVLLASSTWFSGTAVAPALAAAWALGPSQLAWLTISVQLGFIVGTIVFAVFSVADVWNARRVFVGSAILGAVANLAFALLADTLSVALVLRFVTGVTLAGVYPVAMKIVASWFRTGLGWRLGLMVGALTLGTALPYLNAAVGTSMDWRAVVAAGSALAAAGATVMALLVDDGPHLSSRASLDPQAFARVFARREFRLQAIGYFGHMWELYAVWAFAGAFVGAAAEGVLSARSTALAAFAIVSVGALGCVGGGWLSGRIGERRVALGSLLASGALCLASPGIIALGPSVALVAGLVWGVVVVADSAQLSALAARHCPPEYTATALTIQNGIGFAITIGSLQLLPLVATELSWQVAFLVLTPGPLIGVVALTCLGRSRA